MAEPKASMGGVGVKELRNSGWLKRKWTNPFTSTTGLGIGISIYIQTRRVDMVREIGSVERDNDPDRIEERVLCLTAAIIDVGSDG